MKEGLRPARLSGNDPARMPSFSEQRFMFSDTTKSRFLKVFRFVKVQIGT